MSCYIMADKEMDQLVNWIQNKRQFGQTMYPKSIVSSLDKYGNIGQALINMNYNSVNCRYHGKEQAPEYVYKYTMQISHSKALKLLREYIYQCDHDVDNDLYNDIQTVIRRLALCLLDEINDCKRQGIAC